MLAQYRLRKPSTKTSKACRFQLDPYIPSSFSSPPLKEVKRVKFIISSSRINTVEVLDNKRIKEIIKHKKMDARGLEMKKKSARRQKKIKLDDFRIERTLQEIKRNRSVLAARIRSEGIIRDDFKTRTQRRKRFNFIKKVSSTRGFVNIALNNTCSK